MGQRLRGETGAFGQRRLARHGVLPRLAPVGAGLEARRAVEDVAFDPGILLQHHRIGARGQDRAGEDAKRLSVPDFAAKWRARR